MHTTSLFLVAAERSVQVYQLWSHELEFSLPSEQCQAGQDSERNGTASENILILILAKHPDNISISKLVQGTDNLK